MEIVEFLADVMLILCGTLFMAGFFANIKEGDE